MDPLTDPTPGPGAPPVFGFMHVATVGPWRPIVRELFAAVERSGLARRTRRLFLGVVGPEAADFAPPADYAEVAYRSAALGEFEFPTLGRLHRLCGEGPAHVYYCHTKGAWRDRPSVHAWRRYMQHFVIDRHADCIAALAEHDLCGVDWRTDPWPHFSGNFWWARSAYVRRLAPPAAVPSDPADRGRRHACERWIGTGPAPRVACLHQAGVDHYHAAYPPAAYGGPDSDRPLLDGQLPAAAPPPKIAVVFDNVLRPDTVGGYCLAALRALGDVAHVPPADLPRLDPGAFDCYLYVDDGLDYPLPPRLRPAALWAIDTHLQPERLIARGRRVDWVFAAQRDGAGLLRAAGLNCVGWLPLACDPAVHRPHAVENEFDVSLVAHLNTAGRRALAAAVRARFPRSFVGQRFFADMARTYSASHVVLNLSVHNDVNMRVFEALGCGALLLTNDLAGNGLGELAEAGTHLATYRDADDLFAKADHYLRDGGERRRVAAAGREHVLARHTYAHRMRALLAQVVPHLPRRAAAPAPPPATAAGLTSVVVVAMDQLAPTRACVESVRACWDAPYELIVVDNGGADGTREYLAAQPDVRHIENPENVGFPAAVNQALAVAGGTEVLLLNNDAALTPGCAARLRRALYADGRIGLAGPVLNNVPGPQRVEFAGAAAEAAVFAAGWAAQHAGRTADEECLSGVCLLIRREVVDRLGGLDEQFGPGTYDDYDYCLRARRAGYRCVVARDAFVYHAGAATLHAAGVDVPALLARNARLFAAKWSPGQRPGAALAEDGLTSIIVVAWNQWAFTRLCLESIARCTPEPHEVIVVDNGSADETPEGLRAFPHVRVVRNSENRGFPAAANQGIAAASGEFLLLLNNDVVVTPGWLGRLHRPLAAAPALGLVGPVTNAASGPQQVPAAYAATLEDLDEFADGWARDHHGQTVPCGRLVGFCLLLRRSVVQRVGPLDEGFGVGNFEDDDLCLRAQRAGFGLAIARDAFVHHFGSVSFRASGLDFAGLLARNRQRFVEKWGPAPGAGADPPLLSVCLIVRDSSRTLDACLASIRPWVDELVVVDTGSVDDTPAIARRHGARVAHFPWCDDFAAARNASVAEARGAWVFWMDADDTIDPENGRRLHDLVRQPHPPSIMGFIMQVHCPAPPGAGAYATPTVVDHVKLFRNLPGVRFSGRIHEQVLPAIRRAGGEVVWTDLFVVHSGADTTPGGHRRKLERDLRILGLELAQDPDNTFSLFNWGMTLLDAGRAEEAVNALARSLQVSAPGDSHVRKVYALLAHAYSALGRTATALHTCLQGLAQCPDDPELLFRKGTLEQALGRLDDAEASFKALLGEGRERHFASVDRGILGIKLWHNLAVLHDQQRRHADAAAAWRRVLSYDRNNRAGWRGLVDALAAAGDGGGVEQAAADLLAAGADPALTAVARARVHELKCDWGAALDTLAAALSDGTSPDLMNELCRIAFAADRLDDARYWLERLVRERPDDAAAWHNLALVHLRRREPAEAAARAAGALRLRPQYPSAQQILDAATALAPQPEPHGEAPPTAAVGGGP
jgi:GT2 family glycosyltransferase/tetratricopeptide (TPR) repeat protein